MTDFPAAEFHLDGEPAAIRVSAAGWTGLGATAGEAATQIRSLDSSLFIGPEGDQYRDGLHRALPPHLDTTARAYTAVGTTLTAYADTLTGLQDQMAPLRGKAPALWVALQQAQHRVTQAQHRVTAARWADHQHQLQTDPRTPDAYQSDLSAASTDLSAAEKAWNDCLSAARSVTAGLRTAVEATERAIRHAADLRFAHNPHGVHALTSGFKNFVTDHAKGLSQLSGVLKIVSGIAGVLSFIPVIGEATLAVSLITAGAALLLDTSLKYATGDGSWTNIAIDGALLAIPFGLGKALTTLRATRATATAAETGAGADNVVNGTRLADQLARESADSVFTTSGELTADVIEGSHQIVPGSELGNPNVVSELTSDGSNIRDWGKYTTKTFRSPSGNFQAHFYKNNVTGTVNYHYDYKIKFNGS